MIDFRQMRNHSPDVITALPQAMAALPEPVLQSIELSTTLGDGLLKRLNEIALSKHLLVSQQEETMVILQLSSN